MAVRQSRVGMGGEGEGTDCPPHLQQQCPSYTLDLLEPAADGENPTTLRCMYSGPELWTDLGCSSSSRSSSPSSGRGLLSAPPAPSTAYAVRLSMRAAAAQLESAVEGMIITAPTAPMLEPATITAGAESAGEETALEGAPAGEGVGAVTLKATWSTDINTSFLPEGAEPPPFYIALEMSHVWEAGPPTHGTGGTATKVARKVASGQQLPPTSSPAGVAALATADNSSSLNAAYSPGDVQGVPVRKDAGLGQCWTLGSSSWCKPRKTEEEFRVVWRGGEEMLKGEVVEALIPPLPPGMRFAFRVRVECRFGVAVSAATVYQTAPVVPVPPKVR